MAAKKKPAAQPKKEEKKDRTAKLAIVARSIRGINRNLRLQGHPGLSVKKVKGKGLQVFSGKAKTGKVVKHQGEAVKSVRQLTYGQWVTAAVASK